MPLIQIRFRDLLEEFSFYMNYCENTSYIHSHEEAKIRIYNQWKKKRKRRNNKFLNVSECFSFSNMKM